MDGGRLACEFDALLFQLGGNRIDAAYGKAKVIEATIRRDRRRVHAVARSDWSDKDVGAAKLEIDARFALLHAANDLRAEHRFEPLRHRFGFGGAQPRRLCRKSCKDPSTVPVRIRLLNFLYL